tara:strand:- start:3459 stop:4235 length:777 start_codon:yes stop_codon:yes gene_type:complete
MNCNHIKRICQLFLLAILLLPTSLFGQQDTLRVLFVGNSYTYFWNLPQLVTAMAESQGIPIITRQSTVGGSTLEEHWNEEKETKTRALLESGDWDYVVMNNHSMSTINTPADFDKYGKLFAELIKSKGAKPVFYMTWARKADPSMQPTITKGYNELGKSTQSNVVPVGEIWKKSIGLKPEIDLYFPDGSHPSPEGTYLNALAFYKFLTGKATADIPHRLTRIDKDGETMYLAILMEDVADYFQDLVDSFEIKNLPYER